MTNSLKQASLKITAWKVFKYGVFWSVFSPNAGKYGPEKTLYLETFHAVNAVSNDYLPAAFYSCVKREE